MRATLANRHGFYKQWCDSRKNLHRGAWYPLQVCETALQCDAVFTVETMDHSWIT
jgi:hypothetical protein